MKGLMFTALILGFSASFLAQRPVEEGVRQTPRKPVAPETFNARYEGGVFGFSRKEKGRLRFDEVNRRLVFLSSEGKERFSLAYDLMNAIYPQSRSVRSTTGSVIQHIPLPGAGFGGLIREKQRYLIIQFSDADADVRGVANFKLDSKDILESVIQTLGERAEMTARGDAYFRPRVAGGN
jgi:hypothetical protein